MPFLLGYWMLKNLIVFKIAKFGPNLPTTFELSLIGTNTRTVAPIVLIIIINIAFSIVEAN